MLRKPKLGNDFAGREVAAKALVTRRTKAAGYRATGLRRNTQSATVGLGDINRFDGVTSADIEQPLDRAICRDLL